MSKQPQPSSPGSVGLPSPETMLLYASVLEKPQYAVKNGIRYPIPTGEIVEAACAALRHCASAAQAVPDYGPLTRYGLASKFQNICAERLSIDCEAEILGVGQASYEFADWLLALPSTSSAQPPVGCDDILSVLYTYRDYEPEEDESWESWYYAAFDLACIKIRELFGKRGVTTPAYAEKNPQTAFNLGFRAAGGGCYLPPSAKALFQSWLRDGASHAGREREEEIPAALSVPSTHQPIANPSGLNPGASGASKEADPATGHAPVGSASTASSTTRSPPEAWEGGCNCLPWPDKCPYCGGQPSLEIPSTQSGGAAK